MMNFIPCGHTLESIYDATLKSLGNYVACPVFTRGRGVGLCFLETWVRPPHYPRQGERYLGDEVKQYTEMMSLDFDPYLNITYVAGKWSELYNILIHVTDELETTLCD